MPKKMQVAQDKSRIVSEIPAACADERAAVEFFERQRWNGFVSCPHCGMVGESVQMLDRKTGERSRRYLWRCRACKRQFSVRVGTVLEDSRIPLRHWAYAFWAACASKKGVSALQIKRQTGLSYKSALFLMHRIRWAMADHSPQPPLEGIVEVDETYVGGRKRHPQMMPWPKGPILDNKSCVLGLVERGGRIRPFHVTGQPVGRIVLDHVSRSARLISDESHLYRKTGREFSAHDTVRHSIREYARGDVTTNTIEGFFSLLKRGVYGTFHSVSKKHLHRYLSEFEYRYNTRKMDDGARIAEAIRKAVGKRLTYRKQVAG